MMSYHLDPVIFQLGGVELHWFGVLYLLALLVCWVLARRMARARPAQWSLEGINDLILYIALGLAIGGRLGGMLFYHPVELLTHPLVLFEVWRGGLSSHGALLGAILAMALFARRSQKSLIEIGDFLAPLAPLPILAGHLADFINGDTWGNTTTLPWGIVFPRADLEAHHPVQLYGALGEGLLLLAVLGYLAARQPRHKVLSGGFLLLYGVLHIVIEFFREPDLQLGYLAWGWLTLGQLLSLPVVAAGAWLLYSAYQDQQKETQAA